MDNVFYTGRLQIDSETYNEPVAKYSKIGNMDNLDMEEKLITDSRRRFLAKNWKWIYALVGLTAGCFLAVGISYLFFSLGKSKGQWNTQSPAGGQTSAQQQSPQVSSNYSKTITGEECSEIRAVLESIRNESRQELEFIKESREEIAKLLEEIKNQTVQGEQSKMTDCVDWKKNGYTTSGVYTINLVRRHETKEVYCDMTTDGGGWLVFQRRINGTTNFYRNWKAYEDGFGDVNLEFWLGNKYLHDLTSESPTELRIDVMDWENERRFAKYSSFVIGDAASKYTLYVDGYSGNAGDGMALHHEVKFSTLDQDNDIKKKNCAVTSKGAWWYENCSHSSLNGQYIRGGTTGKNQGINWEKFKGDYYSMKTASMMLRRKL